VGNRLENLRKINKCKYKFFIDFSAINLWGYARGVKLFKNVLKFDF
jgi:hypothetical protein